MAGDGALTSIGSEPNGRHQRNGHTLELRECEWCCLQCGHAFDAAIDAELFFCGDPCVHYGGA